MVTVSPSLIVAPVTPRVMAVLETETIEPIEPLVTPPNVKSPNAAELSDTDWSTVIAICEVETVAALENVGEVASIPGAVPDAIDVISIPELLEESCNVIDTVTADASETSPSPSPTVSVIV